ncbi:hypothetical protein [Halorientalis marina]|uniref:hypothetical protein n=1 Tax=Halorientalis marina TaxID=2931976 RepID=UPI001FF552D6|nr:hypothetical protein [Halorientalis marina]
MTTGDRWAVIPEASAPTGSESAVESEGPEYDIAGLADWPTHPEWHFDVAPFAIIYPEISLLWLYRPSSSKVEMTKTYALHTREELLHLDWQNNGLTRTKAQIAIAASEALLSTLTRDDPRVGELEEQIDLIDKFLANKYVLETLDGISSFREAVDKFHIASEIAPTGATDEAYLRRIADSIAGSDMEPDVLIEELENSNSDLLSEEGYELQVDAEHDAAADILYKVLLEDVDKNILGHVENTGRETSPAEATEGYTNSAIYYALNHITEEFSDQELGGERRDGQSVAEAVANATLDVPYPIVPLSHHTDNRHLNVDNLDVGAMDSLARFVEESGIGASPETDDFLTHEVLPAGREGSRDEYTTIESIFIRMYREVGSIQDDLEEGQIETVSDEVTHPAELDQTVLHRLLVERVYDVDLDQMKTIKDLEIPLLDFPAEATTPRTSDVDTLDENGGILGKILFDSFRAKGNFGGAIFQLSDEETNFLVNPYTMGPASEESISFESDRHPDVDSYPALWKRYAFAFLTIMRLEHVSRDWSTIADACLQRTFRDSKDGVDELAQQLSEGYDVSRSTLDEVVADAEAADAEPFFEAFLRGFLQHPDTDASGCPLCGVSRDSSCGSNQCDFEAEQRALENAFPTLVLAMTRKRRGNRVTEPI